MVTAQPRVARPPGIARRIARVAAVVLAILIAVLAFRIVPLLLAPNAHAGVASIESGRDYRDDVALAAAWALPVAATYDRQGYEYQVNQSFCGPASLANLLRSTGRKLTQAQIVEGGPYRTWFGYLVPGLTLDELAELLRLRGGKPVTVIRDVSLAEFRRHMARTNDPSRRYVVNFHRGPLFGRGHGHFSPILGYLADRDLVLVGDVNAAYRPFLVSSEILWRGTDTVDSETGKERGLAWMSVEDR